MPNDSIPDFKPPSKLPVVIGVLVGLIVGAGIGVLVMSQRAAAAARAERKARAAASAEEAAASASAAAAASASAAIAAKNAPAPPLPLPPPDSVAWKAMNGDEAAKKEIEARPVAERTADEAAALARARVALKKKELAELARKITLLPRLARDDKEVAARLKELSSDREIATDTLRMYASLPGNVGPDLLYNVANGKKSEISELADALLYAKDVRPKASAELGALLELRKAEQCEDVKKALPGVTKSADRRAFVPLLRFENKRGCGEKKTDDCWACLREGDELKDAMKAVQKRAPP